MFVLYENSGRPIVRAINSPSEYTKAPGNHLIKSATDLEPVPTSVLVDLYNIANPQGHIKKFSDRTTAINRTFIYMKALSETKGTPAVAHLSKEPKPPKPPKAPREPRTGSVRTKIGIIATMNEFLIAGPHTIAEVVAHLSTRFPERDPKSMLSTVRVNLKLKDGWSPSSHPGHHFIKSKIDKVSSYKLVKG